MVHSWRWCHFLGNDTTSLVYNEYLWSQLLIINYEYWFSNYNISWIDNSKSRADLMNSPPRKPALISLLLSIFHFSLSFPYYHFINYSHHFCCTSFQFLKWTNFAQKIGTPPLFCLACLSKFSIDWFQEGVVFPSFPSAFLVISPLICLFPSRLRPCEFSCLYFRISTENFVFLPSKFRNFTPDFSR